MTCVTAKRRPVVALARTSRRARHHPRPEGRVHLRRPAPTSGVPAPDAGVSALPTAPMSAANVQRENAPMTVHAGEIESIIASQAWEADARPMCFGSSEQGRCFVGSSRKGSVLFQQSAARLEEAVSVVRWKELAVAVSSDYRWSVAVVPSSL